MKPHSLHKRLLIWTLLATLSVAVVSCGSKDQAQPQHPLTEAYRLMDKGDNAKAAILLEQYLQQNPDSKEGKVLVASAYMGEAGVDIYKLYDSFKDVLFQEPLKDRFWGGGTNSDASLLGNDSDVENRKTVIHKDQKVQPATPAQNLIDLSDRVFAKAQKIAEFLNRFPDVPRDKWPLLDSGIQSLNSAGNDRDISLYRIFFRLIYVKAFLGDEVLHDPNLGSKQWACSLDLSNLRENLNWILEQFSAASDDIRRAYPAQASNLNSAQAIVSAIQEDLDQLDQAKNGENTGLLGLQTSLRSSLGCGQ